MYFIGGRDGRQDRFAVVVPGAEVRVTEAVKKKSSLLFRKKVITSGNTQYIPASIIIKEIRDEWSSISLATLSVENQTIPTNPSVVLGGHPDLVLVGWLPETAPYAEDKETLKLVTGKFWRVEPSSGHGNRSARISPLASVSGSPCCLAWELGNGRDHCALATLDGTSILIYRMTGSEGMVLASAIPLTASLEVRNYPIPAYVNASSLCHPLCVAGDPHVLALGLWYAVLRHPNICPRHLPLVRVELP